MASADRLPRSGRERHYFAIVAAQYTNSTIGERLLLACAVKGWALSSGCKSHPATLQPEAIGAVMEATKWLKPSMSVSRIGDSASVQAATRVNAEQASKRTMCRPTRLPYREG